MIGHLLALAVDMRFPRVKEARVAAAVGLLGLALGLLGLLLEAIR